MRNPTHSAGVYSHMRRLPLFLICSLAGLAQDFPPEGPLNEAIQAVWQARSEGHFEDAGAARERARTLLSKAPADSPQLAGWVQQVAQLYQSSGLHAQARRVLEESLGRTARQGDSDPGRIAILNALAESWQQDGNLLKAVGYLEKAAAQATV